MCFSENENCWKQPLTKLLEILGVLKALKKIYEEIGALSECVLEMLHKNFAKLKSCFTPYFFKFRDNAVSACFWIILPHQKFTLSNLWFHEQNFFKSYSNLTNVRSQQ